MRRVTAVSDGGVEPWPASPWATSFTQKGVFSPTATWTILRPPASRWMWSPSLMQYSALPTPSGPASRQPCIQTSPPGRGLDDLDAEAFGHELACEGIGGRRLAPRRIGRVDAEHVREQLRRLVTEPAPVELGRARRRGDQDAEPGGDEQDSPGASGGAAHRGQMRQHGHGSQAKPRRARVPAARPGAAPRQSCTCGPRPPRTRVPQGVGGPTLINTAPGAVPRVGAHALPESWRPRARAVSAAGSTG